MPPKSKRSSKSSSTSSSSRKKSQSPGSRSKKSSASASGTSVLPPSSGFLVTCDVPTKQYIKHLNDRRTVDKQFILEDLDATHLLINAKAKDEILEKVEAWMDLVSFLMVVEFCFTIFHIS